MDKQIIKNIIIEKQIAIPNYKLVHRDFLFGDKSNYILVGIRLSRKILLTVSGYSDQTQQRRTVGPRYSLHQL